MNFADLVRIAGDEPLFETGLLLAGGVDITAVRRQLGRWVDAGKVLQLRRGLYALAPPFARAPAHPYVVANHLVRASYVSCQSVLSDHGLIPEHVPVTVSVTTGRPGRWSTPLGDYLYRHIQPRLFFGYRAVRVGAIDRALAAGPETALLDLLYLEPGVDTEAFLAELRLQNLDALDLEQLLALAHRCGLPKLRRAAAAVARLADACHRRPRCRPCHPHRYGDVPLRR